MRLWLRTLWTVYGRRLQPPTTNSRPVHLDILIRVRPIRHDRAAPEDLRVGLASLQEKRGPRREPHLEERRLSL